MTLMQTLLFGHVPVLLQMTGVHAGFQMMKRSANVCMYIIMLQLRVRKVCNCANTANNYLRSEVFKEFFSDTVPMHNFKSISAAEEIIHAVYIYIF